MPKTFAVIGDPIDHTLSPHIHSAAFRHMHMNDCTYIAYRIPKGELAQGIEALRKIGITGFNVTIPHKIDVMQHLAKTDETCSMVGAANTVKCMEDGSLKGYNTDVDGFMDPFRTRSIRLDGSSVLLLGAGGAARAAAAALAKERCIASIIVANRSTESAKGLAAFARSAGIKRSEHAALHDADRLAKDCNVIINATPIGLASSPDSTARVSAESINSGDIIYDMVYAPMKTDLISKGKQAGATCIMGYEMLLGQAARSFEIWHGTGAPRDAMRNALLGVGVGCS